MYQFVGIPKRQYLMLVYVKLGRKERFVIWWECIYCFEPKTGLRGSQTSRITNKWILSVKFRKK